MRAAVVVVLVACGSSSREVAPPAPPVSPERQAVPPHGSPLEEWIELPSHAMPNYPPPIEPTRIACVVRGKWSPQQARQLAFRAGGAPVAHAYSVEQATLALTADPAGAFVELSSAHGRVWGAVPVDGVHVHVTKPVVLADYALPGPRAKLGWRGGRMGFAIVEATLPDSAKPLVPPRGEVPCDALGLEMAEFFPRAAVAAPTLRTMTLVETTTQLSREPGGPVVAELAYTPGNSPAVDIVEERGAHVRVVVLPSTEPSKSVALVGWVPASAIVKLDHGFGGSWGSGGEPSPRTRRRSRKLYTCAHEVPVIGELAGERHLIGVFAAGVVLDVADGPAGSADEFVDILAMGPPIQPAENARLLTLRTAVADCAPKP